MPELIMPHARVLDGQSSGRADVCRRGRRLPDDGVVGEQMATRGGGASDRFELNRRQSVEQPSSTAGDLRCDHQPELVDDVRGEQGLGHRDTGVDSDVASRAGFQVTDEVGQPAVDHTRMGPLPLERRGRGDELRDPVDERRKGLDVAAWPELGPLVVAAMTEDHRVLRGDDRGEVGIHRVVPDGDVGVGFLGDTVERQQFVYDDLAHAQHLRLAYTIRTGHSSMRSWWAASASRRPAALTWPEWTGRDAATYPSGRIRYSRPICNRPFRSAGKRCGPSIQAGRSGRVASVP